MDTLHHDHYPTVSDLIQACKKAWDEDYRFNMRYFGLSSKGRDISTLEQAIDAYYKPWQEGLDLVQGMIYEIDREGHNLPQPKIRRRKMVWKEDDGGDELDYDRFRNGQDFWRAMTRQSMQGPQFATVITNIVGSGMRSPDEILWRGAAAVCLTDILEKAGYRVSVVVSRFSQATYVSNPYESQLMTTIVKTEDTPVDISSLVNSVSAWFYRTIAFQEKYVRRLKCTEEHGRPATLSIHIPEIQSLVGANSLPVIIDGVFSKEEAMNLIRTTITRINEGVEV